MPNTVIGFSLSNLLSGICVQRQEMERIHYASKANFLAHFLDQNYTFLISYILASTT
jgi:hypothetical protein